MSRPCICGVSVFVAVSPVLWFCVFLRNDVSGAQLVCVQRDQVGLPLHTRPDAGGRLLRGRLQQLPRHLRDQHSQLQRARASRDDRALPSAADLVSGQQTEPAGATGSAGGQAERGGEERRRRQHRERVQSVGGHANLSSLCDQRSEVSSGKRPGGGTRTPSHALRLFFSRGSRNQFFLKDKKWYFQICKIATYICMCIYIYIDLF